MKYNLFGKSGLRVSDLSLGTMTFGEDWGWGADKDESKKIFDIYADAGGNFIDTANRYTEGTSEKFVGEFVRSDRDHFVVATKYTLFDNPDNVNSSGNHRKNMMRSVRESLKRLNTDFIDILWVHAWDFQTPVEEVLRGLDYLVRSGDVHYIGISDTPAWIVSQSNAIAELRSWTAFTGLQIEYNLIQRTPERELLPMARAFDMAVTPWAPLAGGALTGKYLKGEMGRIKENSERRNKRNQSIAQKVLDVAEKLGVTPAQVAIRWTMQKDFTSIPIVGARNKGQMQDSLGSLSIEIPEDLMQQLDEASEIELGFPHDFLMREGIQKVVFGHLGSKIVRR